MGIEFVAAAFLGVASGAWLVVATILAIDTARTLLREWAPLAIASEVDLFARDLFAPHRATEWTEERRPERAFAPARKAVA